MQRKERQKLEGIQGIDYESSEDDDYGVNGVNLTIVEELGVHDKHRPRKKKKSKRDNNHNLPFRTTQDIAQDNNATLDAEFMRNSQIDMQYIAELMVRLQTK